jgi:hypothetical protein
LEKGEFRQPKAIVVFSYCLGYTGAEKSKSRNAPHGENSDAVGASFSDAQRGSICAEELHQGTSSITRAQNTNWNVALLLSSVSFSHSHCLRPTW